MKHFLDASILIEACLGQSPKFRAVDALLNQPGACTSAHALAEAYAVLSGDPRLNINPSYAAQMVHDLAEKLEIFALEVSHYTALIHSAPKKGIRGGAIYDAIHAQVARLAKCQEVYTLNISHFKHVAPDLAVFDV